MRQSVDTLLVIPNQRLFDVIDQDTPHDEAFRLADDVLRKTSVVSPIDGIVSRLRVREGETVVVGLQNQPGTTLMTISDLSEVNAEVKVAEADMFRAAYVLEDALGGAAHR